MHLDLGERIQVALYESSLGFDATNIEVSQATPHTDTYNDGNPYRIHGEPTYMSSGSDDWRRKQV